MVFLRAPSECDHSSTHLAGCECWGVGRVPGPVPGRWKQLLGENVTILGARPVLALPVLPLLLEPNHRDGKPGAKKSSVGNVFSLFTLSLLPIIDESQGNKLPS